MQALVKAFWQIVLFRRGPDYLPDSQSLLLAAAVLYVVIDVLVILALYPRHALPPLLLVDVGFLVVWCATLLTLFGLKTRIRQTLTALFGCGALLQLLAFPFSAWPSFGIPVDIPLVFRALVALVILLWSVAVYGHILSRALSRPLGTGIAFAIVYFIVIYEFAAQWAG